MDTMSGKAGVKEHVAKRRELLKNDDSYGYAKEI
jgi:hypothetical protein